MVLYIPIIESIADSHQSAPQHTAHATSNASYSPWLAKSTVSVLTLKGANTVRAEAGKKGISIKALIHEPFGPCG